VASESTLFADDYLDQGQEIHDELMGRESRDVEIADFPEIGERMLRRGGEVEIFRYC
jgi:hypothetical protein